MTYDMILALAGFAFASSITPGPNNIMLMSSGANFGLRRTLPHMLGVSLGHSFLVFMCGVALLELFAQVPVLLPVLKVLAVAYMLWLARNIALAGSIDEREAGRPLSFLQAAGFQWVNPKGWAMAITAATVYAPDRSVWAAAQVALVFMVVNGPSIAVWAGLGTQLSGFLRGGGYLRAFNVTMAVLLVLCIFLVI